MRRQSATTTIRLPGITDAQAVELFSGLAALVEGGEFTPQIFGQPMGDYPTAEDFLAAHPAVDWRTTRRIGAITTVLAENITAQLNRRITTFNQDGTLTQTPSAVELEVHLTWPDSTTPTVEFLELITGPIDAARGLVALAVGPENHLGPVSAAFAQQLSGLSDLHRSMIDDLAKQNRDLVSRGKALNAEHAARLKELDNEAATRVSKLEMREAAWLAAHQKQEEELERRAAELDNRGHMHARRELRAKITDDLKERLSRPGAGQSIRRTRAYIFVFGGLLVLGAAALAGLSFAEFARHAEAGLIGNNILTYSLVGRLGLSTAATIGLALYLLNWAKHVHDSDLRSDRELERYRYDLDRASWAIETILEAQVKEGSREAAKVPEEWIAGATYGLFARTEARSDDHPENEALGALLSYAAEAEIGPGGTRFKLTPRGVRKLKRDGLLGEAP